ncbi:MAG: DUF2141 domain-containing protein [Rhodospirillaceae bacterium]|nr:DUF2141 domain-containing protein [Rhodospirillaceae bacterium]
MRRAAYIGFIAALSAFAVGAAAQDAAPAAAEAEAPSEPPVQEGACDTHPFSMQITVENVRAATGTITVDVHDDDPAKFLKSGGKLARIRVPAVQGETQFCITVPKAGIYALAVYHDRNGNTKLDKTWIGLPSEPFGLSNNPPRRLAMPKHKDSAFEVNGPRTPVVIDLGK